MLSNWTGTIADIHRVLIGAIIMLMSATVASNDSNPNRDLSLGAGYGILFGGLGVNIARIEGNNYQYASLGVISAFSSDYDGEKNSDIAYGVGVGWIRTDVIFPSSEKHGLGLYLGAVDAESRWEGEPSRRESLKTRYGAGATYSYFTSGLESPGFVIGASILFSSGSDSDKANFLATLGYTF